MKLRDVNLRTNPRAWAEALFRVLGESDPIAKPQKPRCIAGMSKKDIMFLVYNRNRNQGEQADFSEYLRWSVATERAVGRNRQTLWSLLRMIQIFDEGEETHDKADTVRAYVDRVWGLNGEGLERALEGNIGRLAAAVTR